jgi:hypothetical protein
MCRASLLDTGSHRARELAPRFEDREEGKLRGKLLHREQRLALERNIVDTSEGTRANYRCVSGQHFGVGKNRIRTNLANLQIIRKYRERILFFMLIPLTQVPGTDRIAAMHGLQSANSRSLYNAGSESLLAIASPQDRAHVCSSANLSRNPSRSCGTPEYHQPESRGISILFFFGNLNCALALCWGIAFRSIQQRRHQGRVTR